MLIDATVVRLLLAPAVMTLLGKHAWWTPRWLDKIMPPITIEGFRGVGCKTAGAATRLTAR